MTRQARPNQDMINLEVGSTYDVFLGFREYDSFGIAAILYYSLKDIIRVFRDNGNPYSSREIPLQFYSAKIYLPIFSKAYACSPRCLETLALMVEHKSRSGGKKEILPVFYDVERSDLQLEKESLYTDALDKQRGIWGAEKVERWKKALVEVGKAKGWKLSSYKDYEGFITDIARDILLKLKKEHNQAPRDLVKGADPMLSYKKSATRRWSRIRLVVTFLCFLFRLRSIRNRAHSKHMFQRMALSSETYSTSVYFFTSLLLSTKVTFS